MVKWATPSWEVEWDGNPDRVLNAADAVAAVLRKAELDFTTKIDVQWNEGEAEEHSIKEARDALRFAQRPESIRVLLVGRLGGNPGVTVRGQLEQLLVRVRATDFGLAQHLIEVAREAAKTHPRPSIPPYEEAPRTDGDQAAHKPRSGGLGWLEAHQGLIAAIGVAVAVIGLVIAVLLA